MTKEERIKIKNEYVDTIRRLGYTVEYDCDKKCVDEMYDLRLFCTKTDTSRPILQVEYFFFNIPYTSEYSLYQYNLYKTKRKSAFGEFAQGIQNRMVPYSIDDVIAQLLHLGHHIEEVYTVQNGKLSLKLTGSIIKDLMEKFNTQGSPLLMNNQRRKGHIRKVMKSL